MSAVDDVTIADFKAYFTRDFKYLPTYSATTVYFEGDIVYYGGNFYQELLTSSVGIAPPDVTTWLAVSVSLSSYVLDSDITKALNQAYDSTNTKLFENDTVMVDAYLWCAAHYLVEAIRAAEQGIDSRGESPITNKSVGSISVGMNIPETVGRDPQWSFFYKTQYGQNYLSYVLPRVNKVTIAYGGTTA